MNDLTKKLLLVCLFLLLAVPSASAIEFLTTYNPWTGRTQWFTGSNFSGDNLTADFFFGNGSFLTGVSVSPAGSDTQIQFNDAGVFGADSAFVFNKTSGNVGIGTASPLSLLHVEDNNAAPVITLSTTASVNANFNVFNNRALADQGLFRFNAHWDGTQVARMELGTGTDTANKDDGQITFETATGGVLTEKMRIDQDGNVGIGTTSPEQVLHMQTDDVLGTKMLIENTLSDSTASVDFKSNTSRFNMGIGNANFFRIRDNNFGINPLVIEQNSSNNALYIAQGGNVGIGTSTPTQLLDVRGTIFANSTTPTPIIAISANAIGSFFKLETAANHDTGFRFANSSSDVVWTMGLDVPDSQKFKIARHNVFGLRDFFTMDIDGNVGIGTTAPLGLLHISASSGNAEQFFETAVSRHKFRSNSVNGAFAIIDDIASTSPFLIENATPSQTLVLTTEGFVGIGTTTPVRKLHVIGPDGAVPNFPADFGAKDLMVFENNDNSNFALVAGTDKNSGIKFYEDNISTQEGAIEYRHASDTLRFVTDSLLRLVLGPSDAVFNDIGEDYDFRVSGVTETNLFFVDASTDNVGIGTVTPLLRLDVEGSQRIKGTSTSVLTGSIDPAASTAVVGVGTAFTTELVIGDRINVTGETRSVITITDDTNLIVDTAFSDNANDASPDKLAAQFISLDSSGNVDFIIKDNGAVGFGTSAPAVPFDANGGVQIVGQRLGIQETGGGPADLTVLSLGNDFNDLIGGFFVGSSTTTTYAGNNALNLVNIFGEKLGLGVNNAVQMVFDDGNIGIGTVSPASQLHISDGNIPNSSLTGGSSTFMLSLEEESSNIRSIVASETAGDRSTYQVVKSRGTLASPTALNSEDLIGGLLGVIYDGTARQNVGEIGFVVDGSVSSGVAPIRIGLFTSETNSAGRTERLTIKSDGNVGIGTTSPAQLLHVKSASLGAVFRLEGAATKDSKFEFSTNGNLSASAGYKDTDGSFRIGLPSIGDADTRIIIDSSGNVGIGTTSPGVALDVVGTIQSSNQIFYAFEATGGQTLPTTYVNITFDTEIREDALFTHAANGHEILVTEDGFYEWIAQCSADTSAGTRDTSSWQLVTNSSGSFVAVPGTQRFTYHRVGPNDGKGSMSINSLVDMDAGDAIILQGLSDTASSVTTVADGCSIRAVRI